MDDTIVPNGGARAVLDQLAAGLTGLTPETRKAAVYVLEHPNDVGISSIRELAEAAQVKPNTLVRMARSIGFEGYDEFRTPFREEIRRGRVSFTDRARWLRSLAREGALGGLYADMVKSALDNIASSFAGTGADAIEAAARAIVDARRTLVLGVGVASASAQTFAYLGNMAGYPIAASPQPGGVPSDDVSRAGPGDVLIAISVRPYRTEVVDAVALAREAGVTVVAISDSPASPLLAGADHTFVVGVDTPQFFPSSVAVLALLETLMAFVIADAPEHVIERIETFHAQRERLGLYVNEGQ